ncbi:MAG: glycosyltransferase family 4 protein [Thermoguttaceae bacterium]|jgi:glycosyltransferase involved in cell wall biosynthesis
MPTVLILCEFPTLHGGERSMLATLEGVAAAGWQPSVAAPPQGPLAEALRERGVELVPFATRDALGRRRPRGVLAAELAALLHRRRPDLLHANSLSMGRLAGPVAAELGLASLAHLRDIVRLSAAAVADLDCHRRLLAVSQATARFHQAQGLTAEKMRVVYNGVDLEQFRPRAATGRLHAELGVAGDTPLLGVIGQISLRKGQDLLVRALEGLCRYVGWVERSEPHQGMVEPALVGLATLDPPYFGSAVAHVAALPQPHLLIIGERYSGKAESRQFEADLRTAAGGALAGRLHFLGFRLDVDRILSELTLLVHPARQEPLGRVLLEAAAAGVAVIATDVGGTREIFPPECRAARLVPPESAPALARAIAELLADPRERARLATAARGRIEQCFDRTRAAAALVEQYESSYEQ